MIDMKIPKYLQNSMTAVMAGKTGTHQRWLALGCIIFGVADMFIPSPVVLGSSVIWLVLTALHVGYFSGLSLALANFAENYENGMIKTDDPAHIKMFDDVLGRYIGEDDDETD
jgi:hypothetical protein